MAATSERTQVRLDWSPHAGQQRVIDSDARFKIVGCGRRWGKTELSGHEALRRLGEPDVLVWWVAPTYDIADIGFELCESIIPQPLVDGEPKRTKPKEIELINGSKISFRSADREDSLRGEGLNLLILDEAAMIPTRAWTNELRPTLSDTLGDMIAISTPKGRNWFYEWFERGQSPDHPDAVSWQAATYENPHVEDSEIDAARHELPDRVFQQEYLAEFIDESGGVFTEVRERIVEGYDHETTAGESPYVTGVDFARHQDWTVIVTLDATGQLVHFDRVQAESWPQIQRRVEQASRQFEGLVNVDASRDNKIVADLADAGVNVNPVNFSPKKKRELIENLVTRLENEEITIPDIKQLVHELQIFEYDVTPAGNVRYNAPEGFHDDCVDSLALAASALDRLGVIRQRQQSRDDESERSSGAYGI